MPVLQASGGYLVLDKYRRPEIPQQEWEDRADLRRRQARPGIGDVLFCLLRVLRI
jgi:hypothetical protein